MQAPSKAPVAAPAAQGQKRVPVRRRDFLQFGPGPSPEYLVEAPADRFDLKVRPSAVDEKMSRLEFDWRSPAQNLLMHPRVYLEADILVRSSRDINQITQACPGLSIVGNANAASPHLVSGAARRMKNAGLLGFGEGDPLLAACESASIVVNGSSLTTPSPTLWSRPFIRANLKSEDAQKIYGQCGGAFDQYDSTSLRTYTEGYSAAQITIGDVNSDVPLIQSQGFGFTGDTGLQARCRNFFNQIIETVDFAEGRTYKGKAVDARGVKVVRIRWPVTAGGLLNPWIGADLPKYSVCKGLPMGLANCNNMQLSLLFRRNALETLIRDYGRHGGSNNIGQGALGELDNTLTDMRVDPESVSLIVRYYRLSPARVLPASHASKIWRPMVSLGDQMPKASGADAGQLIAASDIAQFAADDADTVFYDGSRTFLMPSGRDHALIPAFPTVLEGGARVTTDFTAFRQVAVPKRTNTYEVTWNNLQYPMLPSQIMICAPKDSYSFSHRLIAQARCVGQRPVFSRDANLSIKKIQISVNTTENTYRYSRDASSWEDFNILLQDTFKNVRSDFMKGDIDSFRTRQHFVLLSSDQFCPIPQMSQGVTSPVSISISAEFQNECVYVDAYSETRDVPANAEGARAGTTPGQPTVSTDLIRSRPVVVAFFEHSSISIAPSSATVAVQSYTAASAAEILAQNS